MSCFCRVTQGFVYQAAAETVDVGQQPLLMKEERFLDMLVFSNTAADGRIKLDSTCGHSERAQLLMLVCLYMVESILPLFAEL